MCEDFLLNTETAKKLYHDYAKNMPIYDFHCHLNPKEIFENKKYKNISEIWLGGDHYKWRAMRSNGVSEDYITGDKSDKEKFVKWAETMDECYGNPLFHWTHLELKRFFGIDEVINRKNAEVIWNKANELLRTPEFTLNKVIFPINGSTNVLKTIAENGSSLSTFLTTSSPSKFLPILSPLNISLGNGI